MIDIDLMNVTTSCILHGVFSAASQQNVVNRIVDFPLVDVPFPSCDRSSFVLEEGVCCNKVVGT